MKKQLILLVMMLLPMAGYAQKRLVSIAEDYNGKVKYGFIEYDDQGRVNKYTIQYADGNKDVCDITYTGSEAINIKYIGSDYEEIFAYTISDGKIQTAGIFFDGFSNSTLTYTGNKLTHIENGGVTGELTWDGDNPSEWYYYAGSKEEEHTVLTFNNISTHPVIHAIWGFFTTYTPGVGDFFEPLVLYPYYGDMPKGLVDTQIFTEGGTKTYNYTYTYDTNDEGDIVKVTRLNTGNNKARIFMLDWEGSTGIVTLHSSTPQVQRYYDLQGRPVSQPSKGLYIKNGKKYLVK
ncbi:MAG: hypothetical protein IKR71_01650 [Bacteroidales bacterium]|nr:hypothetical protein [Bacteroidales bacterium]